MYAVLVIHKVIGICNWLSYANVEVWVPKNDGFGLVNLLVFKQPEIKV